MNSALPQPPSFWKARIPLPFSIRGMLATRSSSHSVEPLPRLPSPCQETVERVVKATRLWSGEKSDVARELIAHFRDAIESGVSPMQATENFGNPKTAARAIRAAKLKNRPLAWHIARRCLQGAAALLLLCGLVYGVMAVRYFTSSPNITRNYASEIASRNSVPEDSRAYIPYRTFYINQHKAKLVDNFPDLCNVTPDVMPGETGWDDAQKYCRQFKSDLDMVRRAAALPSVGAPLSNGEDPVVFKEVTLPSNPASTLAEPAANPQLVTVLMPHLGWSRMIARSLLVDARVALAEGDTARYHQDLLALIGITRQLGAEPFLIGRLVHIAVSQLVTQEIRRGLTVAPEAFSAQQLTELSQALSAATKDTMRTNTETEQLWFDDWLQRSFTDDGHGDGRLTRQGVAELNFLGGMAATEQHPDDPILVKVISPVTPTIMAGRRELHETYAKIMAAAEQDAALPRWQRTGFNSNKEIDKLTESMLSKARFAPVLVFVPAFNKTIEACETGAMNRDATLTAIALQSHFLRTGAYPQSLSELVPSSLPAQPIDIWTGKPLGYMLKDGKPVLYSVGCDKTDNHGAYTDDWAVLNGQAAALKPESKDKDWLYLPQIRKPTKVEPVKRIPPTESTPAPQPPTNSKS